MCLAVSVTCLTDALCISGADPEDVIVSAFKVLDPEATGFIKKELYVFTLYPFLPLLFYKFTHNLFR